MARKQATKARVAVAKASEPRVQLSVINLKGSDEERDWFATAHKRTHIPKATIVRLALKSWAAEKGLPPYPFKEEA
jgi:hypothetical protein